MAHNCGGRDISALCPTMILIQILPPYAFVNGQKHHADLVHIVTYPLSALFKFVFKMQGLLMCLWSYLV